MYYSDDDDDEGRINFHVALSPKTTKTGNNKPKQWSHVIVLTITWMAATTRRLSDFSETFFINFL